MGFAKWCIEWNRKRSRISHPQCAVLSGEIKCDTLYDKHMFWYTFWSFSTLFHSALFISNFTHFKYKWHWHSQERKKAEFWHQALLSCFVMPTLGYVSAAVCRYTVPCPTKNIWLLLWWLDPAAEIKGFKCRSSQRVTWGHWHLEYILAQD